MAVDISNAVAQFGKRGTGNPGGGMAIGLQAQGMKQRNRLAEMMRQDKAQERNALATKMREQEYRDFATDGIKAILSAETPEQEQAMFQGWRNEGMRRSYDMDGIPGQLTDDFKYHLAGKAGVALPRAKPEQRRMIKGADGFQYFADTGERVLPNVQMSADEERPANLQFGGQVTLKDDAGNLFFATSRRDPNTGEITPAVTPVAGGDTRPQGRLSVTGSYGLTADEKIKQVGSETRERETAEQSITQSTKFFEQAGKVRAALPNYNRAIAAIDAGANTGKIQGLLPSFKTSTQAFENAANQLGLNVVSSVTFGALSEGELRLAMDTAVPRGMDEQELRQWLLDKHAAQEKLARYLEDAAVFLGRGGTVADWLESGRRQPGTTAGASPQGNQQPPRAQTANAPLSNAQGWQLMTDAAGNRAYVGPNGEVEEI